MPVTKRRRGPEPGRRPLGEGSIRALAHRSSSAASREYGRETHVLEGVDENRGRHWFGAQTSFY